MSSEHLFFTTEEAQALVGKNILWNPGWEDLGPVRGTIVEMFVLSWADCGAPHNMALVLAKLDNAELTEKLPKNWKRLMRFTKKDFDKYISVLP